MRRIDQCIAEAELITCFLRARARPRVSANRRPSDAINPANVVTCKFKMNHALSCARRQKVGEGDRANYAIALTQLERDDARESPR